MTGIALFHSELIRRLRILLLPVAVTSLLLGGCATHVEVQGTFPQAITQQYPFSVTLVFNDDFRQYRFENLEPREVSVAVGNSQMQLFQIVSNSLFKSTDITHTMPTSISSDLVLVPSVDNVQIAMPYETQLKVFEVWIKYKFELYDKNGDLIAAWMMPAYGKTPTRFLKSESDALNQAAIMTLRDAGANFITKFEKVPRVKAWIANQNRQTPKTPDAKRDSAEL